MPRRDKEHDDDDDEDAERQGLLSASPLPPTPAPPVPAPGSSAAPVLEKAGKEQGGTTLVIPALDKHGSSQREALQHADGILCRICLEEDSVGNLDSPCSCAGTQRFAHQACIQRWVEEKGNTRCEICGQAYRGNYVAPPPVVRPELPMLPVMIVDPTNPAVRLALQRGANTMIDEHPDDPYVRQPAVKFMLTAAMFIVFLIMLHNTAMMDAGAADDGGDGAGGWPAQGPPPPNMPDDGGPQSFADGLVLFLFWILTKLLLIGIPLWAILKVAQRQAQRQQYEELLRSMDSGRQGRVMFRVQAPREAAGGLNVV